MTKFYTNKENAQKQIWKIEEGLSEVLQKKKYSFVFSHKELDFIIQALEGLQSDDRGEIVAFCDKIMKNTDFRDFPGTLIDRLLCSPEVEKK